MPADRSPASRTVVLKAVRIMVCACSSTTAISRFHRMPEVSAVIMLRSPG